MKRKNTYRIEIWNYERGPEGDCEVYAGKKGMTLEEADALLAAAVESFRGKGFKVDAQTSAGAIMSKDDFSFTIVISE